MLALDAKVEQITEADKGALQKPENQEDKVSSKINLMELLRAFEKARAKLLSVLNKYTN